MAERGKAVNDHNHTFPLVLIQRLHPLNDLVVEHDPHHAASIALLR